LSDPPSNIWFFVEWKHIEFTELQCFPSPLEIWNVKDPAGFHRIPEHPYAVSDDQLLVTDEGDGR
jgi:hypothetical protein